MSQSSRFTHLGATLRAEPLSDVTGPIRLIWLHGWGQSRESLRALASSLTDIGENWLIDLPGFGEAPVPPHSYYPADYATLILAWLEHQPPCPTLIIGHSMGFRVALHAARLKPQAVQALVALAGAGVPRRLSPTEKLRKYSIRAAMLLSRLLKPMMGEAVLNALRRRFGSRDYLAVSPAMRATFLSVVNDNAQPFLATLPQPALLLYGADDTETPPNVGATLQRNLRQATFHILPHHNHYSLLAGGRPLVERHLRAFLKTLA